MAPEPPTQVEQLELELGQETVACSAQVVDVDSPEFCLGLQTLLSLKVRLGPDPKMLGQVEGSGWKPGSGWQD